VALIHSIMTMGGPGPVGSFTSKYVFPGGYIPTLGETMDSVSGARLWLLDCEILRKHYAFTIEHWAKRFAASRARAREMYDERFCRMWELYLAGSRASFLAGTSAVMQLQISPNRAAVPLTRDYLSREEKRLMALENEEQGRTRDYPRRKAERLKDRKAGVRTGQWPALKRANPSDQNIQKTR
jgi:cyclopropane-fatty-acyl-phospholipid synthase